MITTRRECHRSKTSIARRSAHPKGNNMTRKIEWDKLELIVVALFFAACCAAFILSYRPVAATPATPTQAQTTHVPSRSW